MSTQTFQVNREGKSGDWRCVVYYEPWGMTVKVFLLNERERKIAQITKDNTIELTDIKEGADQKPLFTLPIQAWQSVLQAIGNTAPDMNKPEVDAELKATKFHLEDMRKLVFDKPIPSNT